MKPTALLPIVTLVLCVSAQPLWFADAKFTPPASPRVRYNFNADWRFIRQEAPGVRWCLLTTRSGRRSHTA